MTTQSIGQLEVRRGSSVLCAFLSVGKCMNVCVCVILQYRQSQELLYMHVYRDALSLLVRLNEGFKV